MRLSRSLTGIVVVCAFVAAAGCGSSSKSSTDTNAAAASSTTTSVASDSESSTSATATDVCTTITTAQVGTIVGGTVTKKDVPGGGCDFSQDDPRAPSASFDSTSFENGAEDFDTAKSGVTATVTGTGKAVPGVGDEAFLVVGTTPGGESQQGAGLVRVGDRLVQVTLLQSSGLSAPTVEAMATQLLTLAASA